MNETIRDLAKMYGVSLDEALKALECNNIIVLSSDMPILDSRKLTKYSQVIADIGGTHSKVDEVQPQQYDPVQPKPRETQKVPQNIQRPVSHSHSKTQNASYSPGGSFDKAERQKQLLGRDYVIFTHMALRKPVTEKVLREVIEVKSKRKTKTKLVVCAEAVEYVRQASNTDDRIKPIADALEVLKKYNMLTTLAGKISEENHAISSFIKERNTDESILVIGVNRGLSTFIRYRNKVNQNDQKYIRIYERDITSKGFLANPENQMHAFEDPTGKPRAKFSEQPKTLSGMVPTVGQNAYIKQKEGYSPVLIEAEIGSGGEASIYSIYSGTKCAKIFKPDSNSELKFEKIRLMCAKYSILRAIDTPIMERIAWPERIIYNEKEEPVGYIMKFFNGTTKFSDFAYDTFEEIIPGVTKQHQVTMAVNFAELVDFMHHNNIILCDINRGNILFDKDLVAYLVDLDSAQIADSEVFYPSNVGIPEFRSPEHIYDKDFSFRKTKADDVWILQMLLFHMLTPDGDPYATSKDFDDERDIVAKGYYPYQAGDIKAEDDIKGSIWHMIVSHFPKFIKEFFWNSLNGQGKNFKEENRRSAYDWLNAMVRYQECLPGMIESDPESGKYMPTAYRKHIQSKGKVDVSGGNLEDLLKQFNAGFSTDWKNL